VRCDTRDDAKRHVAEELRRDWDHEIETSGLLDPEVEEIEARFLPAHAQINLMEPTDYVHVDGPTDTHLGRIYFIQECTDDCPEDE
jgi:hypothetical protein